MYDVVNTHFEGRYEKQLMVFASGVFADVVLRCSEIDDYSRLDMLVNKYPRFASYFLKALKSISLHDL